MRPEEYKTDIFNIFDKKWAILTAGPKDGYNSMTIGWGAMGTLWGRPAVTVYVNPLRYTFDIINKSDTFTVSFFPEKNRRDLMLMGTVSGRDGDRLKGTSLTPRFDGDYITYEEADLTFECRKIFQQTLEKSLIPKEIADSYYAPDGDAHRMYVGELVNILEK